MDLQYLKTIYHAINEEQALANLERTSEKWNEKYPNSMKSWFSNWDSIIPIFKFSPETRKVIYTTNAIESVNSQLRKINKKRTVFPNKISLEKSLYLSVEKISKKWSMPIRNWGYIYGELSIMYEDRL